MDYDYGPPLCSMCCCLQVSVEIALRIMAPSLGSIPAMVGAKRALTGLKHEDISLVPLDTEIGSRSTANYIVWCGMLSIMLEILLSLIRLLKFVEIINTKSKFIISFDIVLNVGMCIGHFAGWMSAGYFGGQGSESTVRNGLTMSSTFCLLAVPLYGLLALWCSVRTRFWSSTSSKKFNFRTNY